MNGQLTAKKLAVRTASGLIVLIVVMAVCSLVGAEKVSLKAVVDSIGLQGKQLAISGLRDICPGEDATDFSGGDCRGSTGIRRRRLPGPFAQSIS